jgi:putative Holliday junction resolvase
MRVLSIDPGSKHIGLAISDPTGTIANPLMILKHISRESDTDLIAQEILNNKVELIIVGQSLDDNGEPTYEGRRSIRIAQALARKVSVPLRFWNESFSTQEAKRARVMMGGSRRKRAGHLDDLAATVILQSFLDAQSVDKESSE